MNFLFEPLNLVTFFPLVGILVILFINREQKNTIRWVALITSLITFGISIWVLALFNRNDPDLQLVINIPWISVGDWTISYLMGIDGINSYSHFFPNAPHLYEPRNWLRLATGMGAGLTLGIITFAALAQALWRQAIYRPLLENWRELAALLALGIVGIFLTLSNQPALLYVLALASTAGLLMVVTGLNTAVLLLFLRSDGQNRTWLEAAGLRPSSAGCPGASPLGSRLPPYRRWR